MQIETHLMQSNYIYDEITRKKKRTTYLIKRNKIIELKKGTAHDTELLSLKIHFHITIAIAVCVQFAKISSILCNFHV